MSEQQSPPPDALITVVLPLAMWRVIVNHLSRGTFQDVYQVMNTIAEQANPQIEAINKATAPPVSASVATHAGMH